MAENSTILEAPKGIILRSETIPVANYHAESSSSESGFNSSTQSQDSDKFVIDLQLEKNKHICQVLLNEESTSVEDYNFGHIKQDLMEKRLAMPDGWAYSVEDETFVKFLYVHPLKLKIHLVYTVYKDMNATILFADNKMSVRLKINFHSKLEIFQYLQKLTEIRFCQGTGIHDRYSHNCQRLVFSGEKNCQGQFVKYQCYNCQEFTSIIIGMQQCSDFRKSKIVEEVR